MIFPSTKIFLGFLGLFLTSSAVAAIVYKNEILDKLDLYLKENAEEDEEE